MTGPDKSTLAAGEQLFERRWQLLKSVPALEFLPPADRPEIAFAGRSNVGKSSLINALVRQGGLARTSNTPGRTQELNYFLSDGDPLYLVDMPGYGYAKAPVEKVAAWGALVTDYLKGRPTLARLFLLVDARHGLKPTDQQIAVELLHDKFSLRQTVTAHCTGPIGRISPMRLIGPMGPMPTCSRTFQVPDYLLPHNQTFGQPARQHLARGANDAAIIQLEDGGVQRFDDARDPLRAVVVLDPGAYAQVPIGPLRVPVAVLGCRGWSSGFSRLR